MHPPPPPICWEGLNLLPNFQKGGLGKNVIFRGGDWWERAGDHFEGRGVQFLQELNSEIFNNQKSL